MVYWKTSVKKLKLMLSDFSMSLCLDNDGSNIETSDNISFYNKQRKKKLQ